jgi:hypothetical protein
VVMGTDCIGSFKSNYHTILAMAFDGWIIGYQKIFRKNPGWNETNCVRWLNYPRWPARHIMQILVYQYHLQFLSSSFTNILKLYLDQ